MKPKVFISYGSVDKHFARNLKDRLDKAGAEAWLDDRELLVGDSLQGKISDAIDKSDFFVVVLSPFSVASAWVKAELAQAFTQQITQRKRKVLPVLIADCDVPSFLHDVKYADFRTNNSDAMDESWLLLTKSIGLTDRVTHETATIQSDARITQGVQLVHAEKELEDFEDMRILEVDKEKCYQPDRTNLLWNIYLRLSGRPPRSWVEIFEEQRRFPRHTMWRRAWIEENDIVIYCPPEEIEQYHLKDLHEDIVATNAGYRKYVLEQRKKHDSALKVEVDRLRQFNDMMERAKFF